MDDYDSRETCPKCERDYLQPNHLSVHRRPWCRITALEGAERELETWKAWANEVARLIGYDDHLSYGPALHIERAIKRLASATVQHGG